jgi:hypothetical protein
MDVLSGSSDPDGDPLTVASLSTPAHGSAVIYSDNTVTYTPASGTMATTDTFTCTISDGYGGTATSTVTVYLADRPPVVCELSISPHGAALTFGVLECASDPDNDALTLTAVSTPTSGTAAINSDGTVTYTPNSGTTAATDSFTYTVSDGYGGTATATVHVYLANRPPVANDFTVYRLGTSSVTFDARTRAYDPDGDVLTVTSVSTPTSGTAAINSDGTVAYTPNSGTGGSTDSFTVTISDGYGGTATAQVTVSQLQPPSLAPLSDMTTYEGQTISTTATASDPQGFGLTFGLVNPPPGASIDPVSGQITYQPATAPLTATITVQVTDAAGLSDSKSFNVTVYDVPPIADAFTASASQVYIGQSVTFTLVNPHDPAGGDDPSTFTYVWTIDNGTPITTSSPTYTTSFSTSGTHTIKVRILDDGGAYTDYTLTINVMPNQPPPP